MNSIKKVSVPIAEEYLQQLRDLAKATGRTVPGYLGQLIKRHLREVEEDPAKRID